MKFENPIMNISMFEVENVVTVSGDDPTGTKTIDEAVQESSQYVEGNTIVLDMGA
ncbi:MAG: hypothetical protein IJH37_13415 [Clostridia bacterium]|nr:hypothetical protein [Clostridia bacterium]